VESGAHWTSLLPLLFIAAFRLATDLAAVIRPIANHDCQPGSVRKTIA